jgi:hypothetical protein
MKGEETVARLRGGFPESPLTARRIAMSTESPGCVRRKSLDAAGVDTTKLANLITGRDDRQSPFAITRQALFERQVIGDNDGMSKVLALARTNLGVPDDLVGVVDLSEAALRGEGAVVTDELRARKTRHAIKRLLGGSTDDGVELIRSPLLRLTVGNRVAWLEPDVVALASAGKIHVLEIRSFPLIDGSADTGLTSQTIMQAAVHVKTLRQLAVELGFDEEQISDQVMIILPDNLSLAPTAKVVSATVALQRLERALQAEADTLDTMEMLQDIEPLPALPPKNADRAVREAAGLAARTAVRQLPFRFRDGCVSCPMFKVCRSDADSADLAVRLGSNVSGAVGSITTVDRAWALITGVEQPTSVSETAVVHDLQAALRTVERAQRLGA